MTNLFALPALAIKSAETNWEETEPLILMISLNRAGVLPASITTGSAPIPLASSLSESHFTPTAESASRRWRIGLRENDLSPQILNFLPGLLAKQASPAIAIEKRAVVPEPPT